VIGWLLDTNVVAALINPNGAPSVKAWAGAQREATFHISVLTLAEYDKGIHQLADDDAERSRYVAARDALEARFAGRVLGLSNAAVRRWGAISGAVRRLAGHPPAVIDTLLAATAVEHRLILTTRNVRDVRLSGAVVFDPWSDDPTEFPITAHR
jgi:predicted nucleic acid-binding protein